MQWLVPTTLVVAIAACAWIAVLLVSKHHHPTEKKLIHPSATLPVEELETHPLNPWDVQAELSATSGNGLFPASAETLIFRQECGYLCLNGTNSPITESGLI